MSYQVIARKWRPQRFGDVVGQQAVTRTLQNAVASRRLAQAFVFAGPRGVGKTTTARILARALNCEQGPTPDPCGRCDACVEIAEGRDMDVLEIDAATHTQVDNVREVIISGLAIRPVRNRYKVFIIDEVHQLSNHSFNALLKSIEEPPPHVVFMMATTELDKIPETVLSRSQVYEFRTIGTQAIADQLRRIVAAEQITADEASLQLIARDAEGSMRDAESKLDQVIAFTGSTVTADDVATVLGLVGRDLVLDCAEAVADEDAAAAFAQAARAVELGYDLRLVGRELSRVARDLLLISVDPSRVTDPEIAAEPERDRLTALARRFSREDLLRGFDLLVRAESDIKGSAQPRYHLEMALLRWIYLRKLVPIEDLLQGASPTGPATAAPARGSTSQTPPTARGAAGSRTAAAPRVARPAPEAIGTSAAPDAAGAAAGRDAGLRDALLAEIRRQKVVFYNTVVVQAQAVSIDGDSVTFTFSASQRTLQNMFEQNRAWLETVARSVAGRPLRVASSRSSADPADGSGSGATTANDGGPTPGDRQAALREQALADAGVQTLLEVFPVEIRDVEEM